MKKEIKKIKDFNKFLASLEYAYRKGFIDGINAERATESEEELTDEEFSKTGYQDILEESFKKSRKQLKSLISPTPQKTNKL